MELRVVTMSMTADELFASYDPEWPSLFRDAARALRAELGTVALRIDHIGSTAITGLDAKPIIDIQVSVAELEPMDPYSAAIERCGYLWRADNPDLTKRYFRERPGRRRTHIHVRRSGSFSEQIALLFRDYLRSHAELAAEYAVLKRNLAPLLTTDRPAYVDGKSDFVWHTLQIANDWALRTGWVPAASDA